MSVNRLGEVTNTKTISLYVRTYVGHTVSLTACKVCSFLYALSHIEILKESI